MQSLLTPILSDLMVEMMAPVSSGGIPVVPGLILHLDAADTGTITTAIGTKVSQFDDKSTEGNDVVQPTNDNQPDTGAAVNGLNALSFQGGSAALGDWLKRDPFSTPLGPEEFFWVFKIGFHTANAGLLGNDADGTNIRFDPSDSRQCRYNNDTTIPGAPGDPNDCGNVDGLWNVNGVYQTTVPGLTLPNDTQVTVHSTRGSISATRAFDRFVLGGDKIGGGRYLAMTFCELIISEDVLSEAKRTEIRNFLRTKWGTG